MVTNIAASSQDITDNMSTSINEDNHTPVDAFHAARGQDEFLIWAILDGILLVLILCGNILTILAVRYSRRLRSVISNQFVLSLAISDILVGLTLPYHLAFFLSTELGESKRFCLLRFFLVIMACCVSIWNLIAIALDRYIAICYPLHYSRYMTRKIALCLMASGWVVGFVIAAIPLIWNKWDNNLECEFDQIFYPWYMVGVITPVFSMVWFCMFFVYCRIWREASKQVKQLRVTGQQEGTSDWKSVQMVLLILGCFTICWLPYFIVACLQIYDITTSSSVVAYMAAFTLAMSNSAMNPLIYAWKNSNFRHAFTNLLKCKSPDTLEPSQSMRSNLHRKSSSAQHQDTLSGAFPNYSTPPFMKKIEPITAMGITFEEDEDKISTYESPTVTVISPTTNIMTTKQKQLSTTNPASVTIKIESDTTKNSIIISTTTLPQQDYPHLDDTDSCTSNDDNKRISLEQNHVIGIDNGMTMRSTTGNLIVNKLIENYGYDTKDYDDCHINKFSENFLNVNDSSLRMNESSKRKSKSANSILVTKHPNKSNSHGSIYDNSLIKYNNDNNLKKCNEINNIQSSNGNIVSPNIINSNNNINNINKNHNLLPTFHFGKKYISKSFNSAVEGLDKCNSSEKIHRKSSELHFPV
ncbi:D(1C) dopamine receptor [Chironomus tepperi]|uniref:D(1C) dopamine receptor n=1 Tax=Chironomus tepperi TaxID=113505 RepID=UPI00391F3B5F